MTLFRMVAFLGSNGMGVRDLMDYEDGLTLSSLILMNVEVGRLSLEKEKRAVNAMTVSLATLFDSKVLKKYNNEMDTLLKKTDVLAAKEAGDSGLSDVEAKQRDTARSVNELNKLNALLGG